MLKPLDQSIVFLSSCCEESAEPVFEQVKGVTVSVFYVCTLCGSQCDLMGYVAKDELIYMN